MSGFEVVGVVLAAIPLIIDGLERYDKGLSTLQAAWKYKNTVCDLITTFEIAAARYRDSCEVLLGPLLLASDDYASLIEEPGGEAWRRSDIEDKLRVRLGSACSTYIRLVHRLYKGLVKFATKMSLDPDNNMRPLWLTDSKTNPKNRDQFFSNSNRIWRGTKMAFENGNLERLLDTVEKDLFRLERLIESSSRVAPVRQEAKKKVRKRPWQMTQTAARSLFNVVSTNWHCKCPDCHSSFLKLNDSSHPAQNPDESAFHFALLVPNDNPPTAPANTITWWRLDIKSQGIPWKTSSTATVTTQSAKNPSKKQAVTFLMSAAEDFSLTPSLSSSLPYAQITKIGSLCDILKQTYKTKHDVGYLEDQSWRHMINTSCPQSLPVRKSELVSIADILGHTQPTNSKQLALPALNPREKYRVALLLANAVLQLFQTPWLTNPATLNKTYLISSNAASQSSSNATAGLPISTIKELYISDQANATTSLKPKRFWIPNETLFALAILLLELSYLAPLSSFKTATDLDPAGNDTPLTESSIAARLAEDIKLKEPSRYSEAIRRCLYCEFDTSSRDLAEESLQDEFSRDVVEPLRELDAFCHSLR